MARVAICTVRGWAPQPHGRVTWLLPDNTVVQTFITERQYRLGQWGTPPDPDAINCGASLGPAFDRGAGGMGLAGDMVEHKSTGWWWVVLTDAQRVDIRARTTRAGRKVEVVLRGQQVLLAPSQFTGTVPNITAVLPEIPGVSIVSGVITIDDDLATETTVTDRGEARRLHGSVNEETTAGNDQANLDSITIATGLTASGSNTCVLGLGGAIDPSGDSLSSATYDGDAMTQIAGVGDTSETGNPQVRIARLIAPNATADADLVFNWPETMGDAALWGVTLSDVDQTTPETDTDTTSGTGTTATLTLTTASGERLYDVYSINTDPTPTIGGGQSHDRDAVLSAGPITRGFHVTSQLGSVDGVMSATWSGSQTFFQAAVSIKEVSGGAISITPPQGNLTLSPVAPTATVAHTRTGATADLTLSTVAPSATVAHTRAPSAADLVLDGPAPAATVAHTRSPAQADLSLTGAAPTVTTGGDKVASPAAGDLSLSTVAPAATIAHTRSPAAVDLTLSPVAPTATLDHLRTGSAADLTLTGPAPSATVAHTRAPGQATLTLSTTAPTVTVEGAGAITRTPAAADLALSTLAPSATVAHSRAPASADLSLSPVAPTASLDHNRAVSQANLTLTGAAPTATLEIVIAPAAANLTLSTTTPTVTVGLLVAFEAATWDVRYQARTWEPAYEAREWDVPYAARPWDVRYDENSP